MPLIVSKIMRNQQLVSKLLILFVVTEVFVSCGHRALYNEFRKLPPEGWPINNSCNYVVEFADTTQLYDVFIDIRHAGNYPYQNLWLFVERLSPDSTVAIDTIACEMADYTGRWLGKGSGSVYLLTVPYRQSEVVETGKYTYKIRQGMWDEVLKGIYAIGLRLEFQHGEE